jgi:phenylacetic acid degradation operon negative regulatory protein
MASSRNIDDPPLTARSVLLSALLGTEPPEMPVGQLVAVAALFGITENSARVALSRMAGAGDVAAIDGTYRLTGRLLDRQASQRASRTPALRRWDGRWTLVALVTPGADAAERAFARTALLAAHLAEQRGGSGCARRTSTWSSRPRWLGARTAMSPCPTAIRAAGRRSLGPEGLDEGGRAVAAMARRPPARSRRRTRARWHPASCSRPRCCATCAPIPYFRGTTPAGVARRRPAAEYDDWDGTYRTVLARYLRLRRPA